jgi:hypothetical protein
MKLSQSYFKDKPCLKEKLSGKPLKIRLVESFSSKKPLTLLLTITG